MAAIGFSLTMSRACVSVCVCLYVYVIVGRKWYVVLLSLGSAAAKAASQKCCGEVLWKGGGEGDGKEISIITYSLTRWGV